MRPPSAAPVPAAAPVVRRGLHRSTRSPLSVLLVVVAACCGQRAVEPLPTAGGDPTAAVSPTEEAARPTVRVDRLHPLAHRLLDDTATDQDLRAARAEPDPVVNDLLTLALTSDASAVSRATAALERVGPEAVSALTTALGSGDVRRRRIAALALLQLAAELHSRPDASQPDLAAALAAARADSDPAVAAAAKHAHRRLTGEMTLVQSTRTPPSAPANER